MGTPAASGDGINCRRIDRNPIADDAVACAWMTFFKIRVVMVDDAAEPPLTMGALRTVEEPANPPFVSKGSEKIDAYDVHGGEAGGVTITSSTQTTTEAPPAREAAARKLDGSTGVRNSLGART